MAVKLSKTERLGSTLEKAANTASKVGRYLYAIAMTEITLEGLKKPKPQDPKARADELFQESQRQMEAALESYREALEANPDSFQIHHDFGDMLSKLGRWEEAITSYQRAIELNPDFFWSYNNLGEALLKLEMWEDAAIAYRSAIQLNQDFIWAHFHYGKALIQLEEWEDAAQTFRRVIALDPKIIWAHVFLSEALFKLGKWEETIELCRYINNLDPKQFWPWQYLGESLAKLERWEESITVLRQALTVRSNFFGTHFHLGFALWCLGKTEEASEAFLKSRKLNRKFAHSYYMLCETLKQVGRWEEVITICQDGIKIDPQHFGFYQNQGEAFFHLDDWEAAINILQQAKTRYPGFFLTHYYLGEALAKLCRYEEAITTLRHSIECNAEFVWSHYSLGATLVKVNRLEEAITAYRQALALYSNNIYVSLELATALQVLGRDDEAIVVYVEAIALDPGNVLAYNGLAGLLERLGRVDEAANVYQQAIQRDIADIVTYLELANLYVRQGQSDRGLELLWGTIRERPNLPFGLYRALADELRLRNRSEEAEALLNSAPPVDEAMGNLFDQIWQVLHNSDIQAIAQARSQFPDLLPSDDAERYYRQNSQYISLNLDCLTEADRAQLQAWGFSLEALQQIQQQLSPAEPIQNKQPSQRQNHLADNSSFSWSWLTTSAQGVSFQQDILEHGDVRLPCPSTGQILHSRCSIPSYGLNSKTYYRFVGKEVFYLVTGGTYLTESTWFQDFSLYFPRLDLVIHLFDPNQHVVEPGIVEHHRLRKQHLDVFKSEIVSAWKRNSRYIIRNEKAKLTVTIACHPHLFHHFWNDLTGIFRLYERGQLEQIDRIFIVGPEYYGRLEDIFPEIPAHKIERFKWPQLRERVTSGHFMTLLVADFYVKDALAQRVMNLAQAQSSATVLQEIETAKQCFPLLIVNIRVGSRSWISQAEGVANIALKLRQSYPKLGLILAGSSEVNTDRTGMMEAKLGESFRDEQAVAEQIKQLLPPEVPVYEDIGRKMQESILWAQAADVYLAPWGSGLVKLLLIANKPGVVHTNGKVLEHTLEHRSYSWEREQGPIPVYVPPELITTVTQENVIRFSIGDDRPHLDNYDCPWDVMAELLTQVIAQLPAR